MRPAIHARGRLVLVLAAVVAMTQLGQSPAAPPGGQIVIRGAHSGSHLELFVRGNRLAVRGLMARRGLVGCRFVRRHRAASCPLSAVDSVLLDLGPSGDFVVVANRLPVPLTAYLGGGSDKFIGNGERDFCFPGGGQRNRCVGGPGDDVCITGPRNSDCVGGPGNDVCEASTGSDGCWGGRGRDVCRMGPGQDGCHGDGGNDLLFGGASSDRLYGGGGFDYCDGGPGAGRSHGCEAGPRH